LSLPWLTVRLEDDSIRPSLSNIVTASADGALLRGGQAGICQGSPTGAKPTCQEPPEVAPGRWAWLQARRVPAAKAYWQTLPKL